MEDITTSLFPGLRVSHSLGDTPVKSCIQGAFDCVEGTPRYLVQQVLQVSDINWTLIGFGCQLESHFL